MTSIHQCFRRLTLALLLSLGTAPLGAQSAPGPDSLEVALLRLLLPRHPDLVARRAARAFRESRLRAAGAQTAPTLNAELDEIPDGVDVGNAGQMRLMFERDFLTGATRAAERALARVERDGAATALAIAEAGVRSGLTRDLALWRGWLAVAARLAAEDSLLQEAESGLMSRFSTGDARYIDLLRIRTERLRVKSERAAALRTSRKGLRQLESSATGSDSTIAALRSLLNNDADPSASFPVALPVPDIDSLMAATDLLRLLSLRVDAARGIGEKGRASRRTQLNAGLGVQRFADDNGGFTVGPALRATISLPFAVGGSNRTQQAADELRVADAEAAHSAQLAHVRTALLLARDRYASAIEQLQVYDGALLTGAREERESALTAYRSGELSLLELLDFERALSRAETEHLRAAVDVSTAYADIFITLANQAGLKAEPSDSGESDD